MKKNKAKKVPLTTLTEEVLDVINNVANRLARRFRFGYHDINDMKQQAKLFALEGLKFYDGVRPLENFLWVHVRNRLFNFKRDKYARPSQPCLDCQYMLNDNDGCIKYNNLTDCVVYEKWLRNNTQKKNLMNFIDLNCVNDEHENTMSLSHNLDEDLDYRAVIAIINDELPIDLRPTFKRLQFGNKLSKSQKNKIQTVIKEILNKHGYKEKNWFA